MAYFIFLKYLRSLEEFRKNPHVKIPPKSICANFQILELAEQYLAFIEEVRRVRLEVAADYLVMAAWLAYLKSRLLLPVEEEDGFCKIR